VHPSFQSIFETPSLHKLLRFEGTMTGDRWTDGFLVTEDRTAIYRVQRGIPDFVPQSAEAWTEKDIEEIIRRGDWIRKNWESQIAEASLPSDRSRFFRIMAEKPEGLIIDVASGPGGGNMPGIINANPEAKILMNDMGSRVLHEWNTFLKKNRLGVNVSFAAFDATSMPIKSGSLDIVTSRGGLNNIPGLDRALLETHRVLKRNGELLICEGRITQESFSQLPEALQAEWKDKFPQLKHDYRDLLQEAGFSIVSYLESDRQSLRPDEAELPKAAAKHGVTLFFVNCHIHAQIRGN
jgi:ubiquinone/menaquinone biosynthesis C-methylase UbiE